MAFARHATTRSPYHAFGTAFDVMIARLVLVLLLAVPIAAGWYVVNSLGKQDTQSDARKLVAEFNPKALFTTEQQRFLPPPVAALPAEKGAGPPAPSAGEAPASSAPTEQVKVANTGGLGAILRAEPPRGRQVAGLRDGAVLKVLERRDVGGEEWVHVQTQDGVDGWIYGRLAGPAQ